MLQRLQQGDIVWGVQHVKEGQCTVGAMVPRWVYSIWGTCLQEHATTPKIPLAGSRY